MSRPRKLSSKDIADILQWARSRVTRKQLAAQKGVSEDTIERVVAQHRDGDPKLLKLLKLCG